MRNVQTELKILTAAADTGAGNIIDVQSFRHKELEISTTGMDTGDSITIKIQGSNSYDAPDFDAAKSSTNIWDYLQVVDQENGDPIDGDTGLTIAEADDVKKLAVNVDGIKWITVIVTAISDKTNTSVTATMTVFND